MVVCSKSCKVLAKSMSFRAFSRKEALLATFSLKIHRNAKSSKFVRKVAKIWPNWWFFVLFHGTSSLLQLFAAMFIETSKHGSFLGNLQVDKIDDFSCFFTRRRTFCNFFVKSSSKSKEMVVCLKSYKDLAKSMIFRAFLRNEALFATFSWKVDRNPKTW